MNILLSNNFSASHGCSMLIGGDCLGDIFLQRAKESPQSMFLTWINKHGDEQVWTYSDAKKSVEKLALALQKMQVVSGDKILLHLDNSPQFVFLFLACSLIGATSLLINTRFSQKQILDICALSQPKIVFTHDKFMSIFTKVIAPEFTICNVEEMTNDSALSSSATNKYVKNLKINHLTMLCIVFTSGTTSSPKGVVWTHGNAIFAARSNAMQLHLNKIDVTFCYLPLYHVMALSYQFLTTLWVGGQIVLPHAFESSQFWDISLKHKCTWAVWIPHDVINLKDYKVPEHCYRFWYAGVYLREWEYIFKLKSIGGWGMSETARPVLATGPFDLNLPQQCMGHISHSSEIYIASEDGMHVNPGEIGDLYIKGIPGITIFLEYFNDPKSTKDAFNEQGWFVTNDRVRLDNNGFIYFVERKGDTFKVAGENVSARVISDVVLKLNFVIEASVVGQPDSLINNIPVLFCVIKPDAPSNFVELILLHCRKELASFMVPQKIIKLDELPKSQLNKVIQNQLKEGLRKGFYRPVLLSAQTGYTAPQTPTEKLLCEIWQEVLAAERVGVNDDFFRLGGSSLHIISLISRMKSYRFNLLANDLFTHPTISDLAAILDGVTKDTEPEWIYKETDKLYSTPNKRLIKKSAHAHHWNISGLLEVPKLDSGHLEIALRLILEQNEGLRHCILWDEDDVLYEDVVQLACDSIVDFRDLASLDMTAQKLSIEYISEEAQGSLDISAKLFKFIYFDLGNKQANRFLYIFHHAIFDAYSVHIFLDDLFNKIADLSVGKKPGIPQNIASVRKWGNFLHSYVNSSAGEEELKYWLSFPWSELTSLIDYPDGYELNASTDYSSYGGDIILEQLISEESSTFLLNNPDMNGVSVAEVFFGSFTSAVSSMTQNNYVSFHIVDSLRMQIFKEVDLTRTLGWLSDDLPVFIELKSNYGIEDKILSVQRQFRARPHSGVGAYALKYMHENPSVRERLNIIPRPEFTINFLAHHPQQNISSKNSIATSIPPIIKVAEESVGNTTPAHRREILSAAYLEIRRVGNQYSIWSFVRDNVYKKSTIENLIFLWKSEVEKAAKSYMQS